MENVHIHRSKKGRRLGRSWRMNRKNEEEGAVTGMRGRGSFSAGGLANKIALIWQ